MDTADSFLVKHPDAGLIITGDFNRMCTKSISRKLGVKQLVKFPTRADAILDLILTNMQDFYNEPTQLPPIGRSDHNSIILTSNDSVALKGINTTVYRRRISGINLSQVSNWLTKEKWNAVYYNPSVEEKTSIFYDKVLTCLDTIMPIKPCRINTSDKPWMTSHIKSLICKRQRAWKCGNALLYSYLRNKVSREIKFATKKDIIKTIWRRQKVLNLGGKE